jgi:hypothetical protein
VPGWPGPGPGPRKFTALAPARRVPASSLSHASESEPVIRLSRCVAVTATVAAAAAGH